MLPRVILKENFIKKSQQKKITSPANYKERFFELDTHELKYSEIHPPKPPIVKGCIELVRIKCVEIVCSDVPIPCCFKFPFQVYYDNYYLYIFAPSNDCRQRWVRALKEETKHNDLVAKYHPNFWMDGKWKCCKKTEKLATGCHVYDPTGFASEKSLPKLPQCKTIEHNDGAMTLIPLQNYAPLGDNELPLEIDKECVLIDSSNTDWWIVTNSSGETGFVPSTYVAKKSGDDYQRFAWFNKDITRAEAEDLLKTEGREGGFMVRHSSQAGTYTTSVFTKALGSNGEQEPKVKHYHIKQAETGEAAFYLAEKHLFSTIPQLIHYHQHNAAGLITRLRRPASICCPPPIVNSVVVSSFATFATFTDQWEIDPNELTLGKELGSGQFGLVQEGTWRDKKVAVKTMKDKKMSEDDFREEARVMTKVSHSKLVQLYGVCTQCSPMCLVFEFMHNGSLSTYLQARKEHISPGVMLGMCVDVSEGMAYLESSNFIHRDLAARNCLVNHKSEVKVCDFGMTRLVLDDQYTSSMGSKFPVRWSAPEVIRYAKFSSKSDVWSFGVLMWEVYNKGRLPYENKTNLEVMEALNAGMRLLKPRLVPDEVYLLMEWCWKEKPEQRPSFAVLLHELAAIAEPAQEL
ncbi:tyrosine-protein kinase ITK/TSK [Brachionichthys hirsutus]|uniref:tyrosine-protein kinase ITK/TSK n=1 Tax=Brachionichthys hirsutus TaxID=412623 RepID=UPI00360524F5